MTNISEEKYWTQRYNEGKTGWDVGYPSTPIKSYIDQLENKDLKILIPGAGNAYEAEYLWKKGFKNVFVLDISEKPLEAFANRVMDFPKSQLILGDFFEMEDQFDLIIEQTFFCSFIPTDENRSKYFKQMAKLLNPGGKLAGVWFDFPLTGDMTKRPFGGNRELYLGYLKNEFEVIVFEKCYNSIAPRMGNELFGIFTPLKD